MHGSQMMYAIYLFLMIAHMALGCDPLLTRLFTPPHPQRGEYEVCTTPDAIEQIVAEGGPGNGVHYAEIEALLPAEALGAAGPYDRSAVARLYGARRPSVARGWRQLGDRFESVTLVSPYPDASLTRLERGTMVIRWSSTSITSKRSRS
jgi:hypothetical protein